GNGVRVITSDTTRSLGERGGSEPIFDELGEPRVAEVARTEVTTSEFDPDAGAAGGKKADGHQFREITKVTVGATTRPDGSTTDKWATPLTTRTLNEGFDDDWVFEEQYLKTK